MTTKLELEPYTPRSGELAKEQGFSRLGSADYKARCWVQGARKQDYRDGTTRFDPNVGAFHPRFHDHPYVRRAIAEGWDRELRSHIIGVVKFRLLKGEFFTAMHVEDLMPGEEWIHGWAEQARRSNEAEAWRREMEATHGSMEAYFTKTAGRRYHAPAGRAAKKVVASLTDRSLAMTGEAK